MIHIACYVIDLNATGKFETLADFVCVYIPVFLSQVILNRRSIITIFLDTIKNK